MTDKIRALAASIAQRKSAGVEPFVLLVGAGASISSGCSPMTRLVDEVLQSYDRMRFDGWQKSVEAAAALSPEFGELKAKEVARHKLDAFYETWERLDHGTRFSVLKRHLFEGKAPSKGYADLAHLVAAGYFKVALSTNLDILFERALGDAGWREPDNFVVAVNGKDTPEEVRYQLESAHAPFKLVKLHGTLASPRSYAFTSDEIFKFEETIKPELARHLNRSLLVVGHSLQDRDIDVLFDKEGGEIHFVNPSPPEPGSRIDSVLKVRGQGSVISGEAARFDDFFRQLRGYLEAESGTDTAAGSGPSIEGFLKAIGYEHELTARYSRLKHLPTLYVRPTEYDDIRRKLERDHVIFIVGEPHLGKTYTAFHLLWEYYQQGYEPLHIRHDRLVNLLHRHDGDLQKLLPELFVGESDVPRVVHFDDPFGGTLERRTERTNVFARELDRFLTLAREYEHVRVVVTTRLNVFREAVGETLGRAKLHELEESLRVHTSYRRETLLDILHRYTKFYRPAWASDAAVVAALDEQLPALLPAPHNIEFFVRTSESLTTLEALLRRAEESKEMVKALADWMGHLPPPEQVFLLLVEIAASSAVLFPGTPAAAIDVEAAYMEALAYLFKRKHLPSIPTASFESARAKFDQILVESRDGEAGPARLDFVHPSYHEAFWHSVRQQHPLARWWELMQSDVNEIFKDFESKPDPVQLSMIEQYGTIARDLDRLLLLTAESGDPEKQIIAFEHMLARPEKFAALPQFSVCLSSITSTYNERVKLRFLELIEARFDQLPLAVLEAVPPLLFDGSSQMRKAAEKFAENYLRGEHNPVKNDERLRAWEFLLRLFEDEQVHIRRLGDLLAFVEVCQAFVHLETRARIWMELPLEDFKFFIKMDYHPSVARMVKMFAGVFPYEELPEDKLEFLLSCPGFIQYEALTAVLRRHEHLTARTRALADSLVASPQERWVGGAIGAATTTPEAREANAYRIKFLTSVVARVAKDSPKEVAGALLAELADKAWRGVLQPSYEPSLAQLMGDEETVRHALTWIEHKLETSLNFSEPHAATIRYYLLNPPAKS